MDILYLVQENVFQKKNLSLIFQKIMKKHEKCNFIKNPDDFGNKSWRIFGSTRQSKPFWALYRREGKVAGWKRYRLQKLRFLLFQKNAVKRAHYPKYAFKNFFQLRKVHLIRKSWIALHSSAANLQNNFKTSNCENLLWKRAIFSNFYLTHRLVHILTTW